MSNRKSKDKLEALFGNLFNEEAAINKMDGWNQPSDEIWDQIHAELHPKQNKNRLVVFLPWMAIAASSLLLIGCFQFYQLNTTNSSQLSYQQNKKEQVIDLLQSHFGGGSGKEEKINHPLNSNAGRLIAYQQSETEKDVSPLGESPLTNTQLDIERSTEISINNKLHQPVAALTMMYNPILTQEKKVFIQPPITPITKNKSSFYLGANYTPSWKESGVIQFEEADNIAGKEYTSTTISGGLTFGVQLQKGWILESGLQYRHSKKSTIYTGGIPYEQITENPTSEVGKEYVSTLPLGSTTGSLAADLLLTKNPTAVTDHDEELDLSVTLSHSVKMVDIPILAKKQWAVGSLGLSVKAGILNRFILQNKVAMPEVIAQDQSYEVTSTILQKDTPPQKTTTYSGHLVAGVGLDYALLPRLSLYVEPTFTRSLQPTKNLELASVYTSGKMVDVGVRYDLR